MALLPPTPRGFHQGDDLLVIHDFLARGPDELTLKRGQKILLVELDDGFGDGWYLGKDLNTGVTGLFPGVYTTKAPNIPVRPPIDVGDSDSLLSNGEAEEEEEEEDPRTEKKSSMDFKDSVSAPRSEDSTPHASRHASMSDLRASPDIEEPGAPPFFSPKQQQRSSSSPLPGAKMAVDIQQTIRQTLDPHINGQDSPVMNETLSVIDEHITDLSTPRHSVTAHDQKTIANDSASEYSRGGGGGGQEEHDEEGNPPPEEEEVRNWTPVETAKHLRHVGVEEKHCEIFEEQEIAGDVLLDMNQDFIFMKEFDFGVMGRRLKTWHKIKAFQEEVKGLKEEQQRPLSRTGQTGPLRPRMPNLRGSVSGAQHPRLISSSSSSMPSSNLQSNPNSPLTPQTPPGPFMDHSRRPSAASIREINHSRRHSSLDTTSRYSIAGDGSPHFVVPHHHKKSSFDRGWTMSRGAQPRGPPRPGTALGASTAGSFSHHQPVRGLESAMALADELDRGYFSGPEVDTRTQRRFLPIRTSGNSSAHSLHSNITDEQQLRGTPRHSRMSSAESIPDDAPPSNARNPAATFPLPAAKGRLRSLSTRVTERRPQQSSSRTKPGFFASLVPLVGKSDPDGATRSTPQPLQQIKNAAPKFRRAVGLRAMSDVIGKGNDPSPPVPASPVHEGDRTSSIRTGSTTPSTSKSSERHSTDGSGKAVEGGGGISLPRARPSLKAAVKSKKDTSAYTRGLEKKSPQEQMAGCEFSGWMKKRSSNLMTTWKPRLFVLRGRRLSYYYSENDTEERGLIDITAHRVLRADNDPIVALHATITGATVSPSSPVGGDSVSDKGSTSESQRGGRTSGEGSSSSSSSSSFFFKLVPPKTGTSRTVQFTKPAIHYFQVDGIQDGRRWMAALMKATIERDMDLPVETTNKQRTISLKEAQLMNQRPPTLMTEADSAADHSSAQPVPTDDAEGRGLMIQGLNIDQVESPVEIGDTNNQNNSLG
ncbi:hypothetical protein AOCH_007288 [Aspergillus ochraceoroseus]|uniref:Polarized growth protein n=1 Tax=Aspergillus ochraceoroseus TaxID=138278 RepID=A0A0F8UPH8_9EURO|nr:hypothetical protein AOCH_007288 [Aspergillus ochraceoroseus]